MSRIVGVISGKGGVGKTVVSINTAAALQKFYGMRTLLVDCNITTSHLGLYLGMYSTPVTLNDALKGDLPLEKTVYEHSSGIDVIPASLKLEDLRNVEWQALREKILPALQKYDFIILDSSPGFNRESLITLGTCHEALLVTTPVVHTVADAIKCKQLCDELNVKSLGIVLNMVRKKKYELHQDDVSQMAELPIISKIPYHEAVMESIICKTPTLHYSGKMSPYFRNIADFLMTETVQDVPEIEDSFFSKFMKMFSLPKGRNEERSSS